MGVLNDHETRNRLVGIRGVAEGFPDLVEVEGAVSSLPQSPDRGAHDDRMTGGLVEHDVGLVAGDRLLAAPEMGHLGDEVAHRPGGNEERGFLAKEVGGPFLEGDDGGIVAEDVVPDLRLGHRPAHFRRRLGDGVRTQIDDVHGLRRIPPRTGWSAWTLLEGHRAAL